MTEPFRFNSGQLAYSVQDLIGVCHQSPQEVIDYLKRGDFEKWLAYIGEEELSKKVAEVHYSSLSDEEKLKQFLVVLQPPQPEKVTATPSQEDKTSTPNSTITPSPESSFTTEVENIEPTDTTTESTETSPITQAKETTSKTTKSQESTETTSTNEVKESTPKATITESQESTETTAKVTQKFEEKEPKPIASVNENSDESPKANSPAAKAMKNFMSRYISNQ